MDSDVIVVGGGLSNVQQIYKDVINIIPQYTISDLLDINLYQAEFRDSSGIRGAAWLGKDCA